MPRPMTNYTTVSRQMAVAPETASEEIARAMAEDRGLALWTKSVRHDGKVTVYEVKKTEGRFFYWGPARRWMPVKRAEVRGL